jgi:hypothetical protein
MSVRADILEEIKIDLNRLLDPDAVFLFSETTVLPVNVTSPETLSKLHTPLAIVGDLGVERLVTRAPDGSRYAADMLLRPVVSPGSVEQLWTETSNAIFAIRDWLHKAPTDTQIHSNVNRFLFRENRVNRYSESMKAADALIEATLYYWEPRVAPALSYIYGSDIAKTSIDLILTQLGLLKTAIGSNVPGINNIYSGHNYAGLRPTAITVQLDNADEETDGWNTDTRVAWRPQYSIRVITDVINGERDSDRVMYLLQGIANWFKERINLTDSVRVEDVEIISVGTNFEDVELFGGELRLTTRESVIYTQI